MIPFLSEVGSGAVISQGVGFSGKLRVELILRAYARGTDHDQAH